MEPFTIREARSRADYDACVALQRAVWGLADLDITSTIQLVATVHAGGLLLVAESAGREIVGFCYAFAGFREGRPHLHSDMLAVKPAARAQGLGARLKWAQREVALARGLSLVTWTFDPMRALNARLNLHHLGARATEFLPDFYGETSSPLHHGPTDRLLVRWEITSPAVAARAAGQAPTPPEDAPVAYEVEWREDGRPVPGPLRPGVGSPRLLLPIPEDWDDVVRADRALAGAWQAAVRAALSSHLARGYAAIDLLLPAGSERRLARYVLETSEARGG
jgi:predicted GNAT superfamily acetyltransferase